MDVSGQLHARFTPRERAPVTYWIGGWVDPRASLDAVAKRKIPSPRQESNPRTPIGQPVAQSCTDRAITALEQITKILCIVRGKNSFKRMFLFKIEVLKTLCVQIRTDAHRCVLRHFPHDLQFTYVILSRSLVLFGG
jgi:hypothetical protein